MKKFPLIFCCFLCVTVCANAKTISGYARVTDGDTISVNGKTIRLLCIDAPESYYKGYSQYCLDNETNCGVYAKRKLRRLVAGDVVACKIYGTDIYNRNLGICYGATENKKSLNEQMLDTGYAAYYKCEQYPEWADKERQARLKKRGLYTENLGGFINPHDWRKGKTNDQNSIKKFKEIFKTVKELIELLNSI